MIKLYFCLLVIELRIDLTFYKSIIEKLITMSIKGKCAIYIDKNLRVYENSTTVLLLCASLQITVSEKNFYNV